MTMIEIKISGGTCIDNALEKLKHEAISTKEICFTKFNGECIYSTDSLDEAYKRVIGKTKAEHQAIKHKILADYKRREEEHKVRMPEICEKYRKEARGLVLDETLDEWDRIMEIRVGDIYHGMEMKNTLDCCRVMRDKEMTLEQRLRNAYKIFNDANHSGMSAALTIALIRKFCPNGNELADACGEFRYEQKTKDYKQN